MTFHPTYKDTVLQATFRVDFLCDNDVIVECKAVIKLDPNHRAQLFNVLGTIESLGSIQSSFVMNPVKTSVGLPLR